ncbi:hypothetical protein N7463_007946 [Penicillium fimorum]|uniref:AMP-binding enzyme C-terminal domain-containing protein n=1 Tax=Penicillium fimorum TaxID=1882269 RepID=A0A9X0C7M2_9EURO|nr:hypothetical protein N7463_007946 [Penicillium fimorum]
MSTNPYRKEISTNLFYVSFHPTSQLRQLPIAPVLTISAQYSFQIGPSELESMLLHHPDVIDAAICAVYNDSLATEVPLAYVSLVPDKANLPESRKSALLHQIGEWINGQVAGYKKIRGGVFHLQTLPKTPTGEIQRRLLPAKLQEQRKNRL